ncbi:hypothetical protein [Bacterioplanoides sp.]|uniref:hypothetical protein n=1 Tax=Bacterioplanoides sp. TaxID=2066072 RepID=UPI003B5B0108
MDTKTLIVTILSSSFLAATVTSLASGLFSLKLKKNDFLYDFHKNILDKRIMAYETVESIIASLRGSIVDQDGLSYHQVFSFGNEEFINHLILIQSAMKQGMWLSSDITKHINQINYIYLNADEDLIEFGKDNYESIANERNNLENVFARDISKLHEIEPFLLSKSNESNEYNFVNVKSV